MLTQYLRRAVAGPPRPVAFLDRDGIINQRVGAHDYVTSWDRFKFADGAVAMLRGLNDRGYSLIVITNQQGVGKGLMSTGTLNQLHEQMRQSLSEQGIVISGVFHCPHLENRNCFCRKPRPGLIFRAMNESPYAIDVERSILIGDSESDILAGKAAGIAQLVRVGAEGERDSAASHVVTAVDKVLDVVPSVR